jgi:hypothetical protein
VAKRLAGEPTAGINQEVLKATRRWTGLGLIATTVVLGWAAYSTYLALADETTKGIRSATAAQMVGPWKVSAFREGGGALEGAMASTFGVRFHHDGGHANYRQASLAFAEQVPQVGEWQIARGGLDERKAKLAMPAVVSGGESLWVSVETWDGVTHQVQFALDAFQANSASRPTAAGALGGVPVIVFIGAFIALVLAVAAPWYWMVWWRRHRAVSLTGLAAGGN